MRIVSASTVGINWPEVLVDRNENAYGRSACQDDGQWFGAVRGGITYFGVTASGMNAGASATITPQMISASRRGEGAYAKGPIPYFKNGSTPGVHRGHLVARCLGGAGGTVNWVPLKADQNVADMWHKVERAVFEWLKEKNGYVELTVIPQYRASIPVPSMLQYEVIYHWFAGGKEFKTTKESFEIPNHLDKDTISAVNWFTGRA
jgi:hypothetical protein